MNQVLVKDQNGESRFRIRSNRKSDYPCPYRQDGTGILEAGIHRISRRNREVVWVYMAHSIWANGHGACRGYFANELTTREVVKMLAGWGIDCPAELEEVIPVEG